MENNGEKLYEALLHLIDISENVQKSCRGNFKDLESKAYLKEFCTIRVCTSRRGGHDYAIAEAVKNKFSNKNVLTVSINNHCSEFLKKEIKDHGADTRNISFVTSHTLSNARGLDIDTIIVNCSFMLSQAHEDEIYNLAMKYAASKETFFVIFVQ
jgi:hypothetical protein